MLQLTTAACVRASGQAEGLLALNAGVAGPPTWHVRMAGRPWRGVVAAGAGIRATRAGCLAGTYARKNGGCRVWGQEVL